MPSQMLPGGSIPALAVCVWQKIKLCGDAALIFALSIESRDIIQSRGELSLIELCNCEENRI